MKEIEEEARNLKIRINAIVKNKAKFARDFGIKGSGTMVYQHENAIKPISLEAGKAYARGLGCTLGEISPRLAKIMELDHTPNFSQHGDIALSQDMNPTVEVPLLSANASMCNGNGQEDANVVIDVLRLSHKWVEKTIRPLSDANNLRFIHAYDDSMLPTLEPGDILLVDTGIRNAKSNGIFVLSAQNKLFIKRVNFRMDGTPVVSSDNPAVKTIEELDGSNEIDVLGRVVWAWNGKKL